jgi:hypothetical protein
MYMNEREALQKAGEQSRGREGRGISNNIIYRDSRE